MRMTKYIKQISDTRASDGAEVGEKIASLGEIFNSVVLDGIQVPDGFAVNVAAFKYFLDYNKLNPKLHELLDPVNRKSNSEHVGKKARDLIMRAKFPPELESMIIANYSEYFERNDQEVAVRSSVAYEYLPDMNFPCLHNSFLNIKGPFALIYAIKCCYASLYLDRAIQYREDKDIPHDKVFMCVGVQQMVRSDLACSGTGHIPGPAGDTGDAIQLLGSWGLGDYAIRRIVIPDEFRVLKPLVKKEEEQIIQKKLGSKSRMLVYNDNAAGTNSTLDKTTPRELRAQFVLSDTEINTLVKWSSQIDQLFSVPLDFEWAKDGLNQLLYIIEARPKMQFPTGKDPIS